MKFKVLIILVLLFSFFGFYISSVKAATTPTFVTCKTDGSTLLKSCVAAGGMYGACRADGFCADTNAGPIPASVNTSTVPAPSGGTSFTNPLKFSSVEEFLGGILTAIQRIIVTLALVAIVFGALLYVTSAGNSKQIGWAKDAITAAMIGLALGVAAPSILKELAGIVGWGGTSTLQGLTITQIAMNLLNFLLGIMGLLALIMLVLGGVMYITSAGDEGRAKTGKNMFQYSLLGVVIAMSAMVLVRQIAAFFVGQ